MRIRMTPFMLVAPALVMNAQTPAPAPAPNLAQRYAAEQPAIDKLIQEFKPREAMARAEALIPATIPAFDKKDLRSVLESYYRGNILVRVYSLAGKASFCAGYWEKALDYDKKAADFAKQHYEDSKSSLTPAAVNLRSLVDSQKKTLADTTSYVAELKAKPNPDEGDKQQIKMVEDMATDILNNEKWAKTCDDNVEGAKKSMEYYATRPAESEKYIKEEADQLASYHFPNDKVKFVEGAVGNKKFMDQIQDRQMKIQYLHRLNVLDPDNKKVVREIDLLQGKAVAPEKPAKAVGKKKK
jgi:hypothetical protein